MLSFLVRGRGCSEQFGTFDLQENRKNLNGHYRRVFSKRYYKPARYTYGYLCRFVLNKKIIRTTLIKYRLLTRAYTTKNW